MDEDNRTIRHHYGFYGAFRAEYGSSSANFEFEHEKVLGVEPLRADVVAVKRNKQATLTDGIGRFLAPHNIIEYKSPDDTLNIKDFYKIQGYACIYQWIEPNVSGDELAISIFRHRYPREMFKDLHKLGRGVEETYPGVYVVTGPLTVPAQVIVTSRLPPGEYGLFKILTKGAKREDIAKFLEDFDLYEPEDVRAILGVSTALNEETYRAIWEEGRMVGALERLMQAELARRDAEKEAEFAKKEAISKAQALSQGRSEGIKEGRKEGRMEALRAIMEKLIAEGWDPARAAEFTGLG